MTNKNPSWLRDWRRQHGLSQAETARRLGVTERTVRNYELRPDVPPLIRAACAEIGRGLKGEGLIE